MADKNQNQSSQESSDNKQAANEVSDVVIFKTAPAAKLSQRATGLLTYQLGFVESVQQLFMRIEANQSGGYFSKEWVAIEVIQALLLSDAAKTPFPATLFKERFVSKSQNNARFLAAALKAEGLLQLASAKSR